MGNSGAHGQRRLPSLPTELRRAAFPHSLSGSRVCLFSHCSRLCPRLLLNVFFFLYPLLFPSTCLSITNPQRLHSAHVVHERTNGYPCSLYRYLLSSLPCTCFCLSYSFLSTLYPKLSLFTAFAYWSTILCAIESRYVIKMRQKSTLKACASTRSRRPFFI